MITNQQASSECQVVMERCSAGSYRVTVGPWTHEVMHVVDGGYWAVTREHADGWIDHNWLESRTLRGVKADMAAVYGVSIATPAQVRRRQRGSDPR